MQLEGHVRHDAEQSLRPRRQPPEPGTGRRVPVGLGRPQPPRRRDPGGDQVVADAAIAVRALAAARRRHRAAQRHAMKTLRIMPDREAQRAQGVFERRQQNAGLHDSRPVHRRDREDAVQPRHVGDDPRPRLVSHAQPSDDACPAAARRHGQPMLSRQRQQRQNLVGAARQHHGVRHAPDPARAPLELVRIALSQRRPRPLDRVSLDIARAQRRLQQSALRLGQAAGRHRRWIERQRRRRLQPGQAETPRHIGLRQWRSGQRVGMVRPKPAPQPRIAGHQQRTVMAPGMTWKVAGILPGDSPSMSSSAPLATGSPIGSTMMRRPRSMVQNGLPLCAPL
jgi:hypothetical protein